MNREEFIKHIIERVRNPALYAMETNLRKPAGRKPDQKLLEMSQWYTSLSEKDRSVLRSLLIDTIDETIFGFFCVLDGVRGIDEEGSLLLIYKENEITKIINNEDIGLHDIYNELVTNETSQV